MQLSRATCPFEQNGPGDFSSILATLLTLSNPLGETACQLFSAPGRRPSDSLAYRLLVGNLFWGRWICLPVVVYSSMLCGLVTFVRVGMEIWFTYCDA